MITAGSILVLCISSFVFVNGQHDGHKVKVAVYYESMCPDSIDFVTKQLHPALQKPDLNKHIDLTLVPYGKSKTINNSTGTYFECHHGPAECVGNKLHACALADIQPQQDGSNPVAINFVNCLLATVVLAKDNTQFPNKTCAESQGVTNLLEITNCATATMGSTLLKEAGAKTSLLPIVSSPTVVFNEKFDAAESKKAEKNFEQVLCSYIHGDKPSECKNKNSAETQSVSLGISLLMVFFTISVF